MGELRWVDTPGEQAVQDDPGFFKKVFCINNNEYSWYPKGNPIPSVKDVPVYSREMIKAKVTPVEPATPASPSQPFASPTPISATPAIPATPASPSFTPTPTSTPSPTPTPIPVILTPLVTDNFNSYQNGLLWGQGGWTDIVNGESFIVQSVDTCEGGKAISNNYHDGPAIITKSVAPLSNGKQSIHFKTSNRAGWTSNEDGNIQIRITKGLFNSGNPYAGHPFINSPSNHPSSFIAVTLRKNGYVTYYDSSQMAFKDFGIYNDNEWTQLEVEWRSSDKTARYRVGNGAWTAWLPFYGGSVYSNFDSINLAIDNRIYNGSGEVYFDNFGDGSLACTPTPTILPSLIQENFNSYASGSVVDQGDWLDRDNGSFWVNQDSVTQEGAGALFNNYHNNGEFYSASVIQKFGTTLADGKQSFYIRTYNRNNWGNDRSDNVQVGVYQEGNDGPTRATVSFRKDGTVTYVNGSNDTRVAFDTYSDNTWNLLDIEWRISDKSARFRLNNGAWTNWVPFTVVTSMGTFIGFNSVVLTTWYLGTGGVYIDNLN